MINGITFFLRIVIKVKNLPPIDPNKKLGDSKQGEPMDVNQYQRLVGKLIYLAHTRPNIAFAVSLVSQFMHAPIKEHLEATYIILRY